MIVIEAIGVNNTAIVSQLDLNADDDGDVEISPSSPNVTNNIFTQFYSIFAKDRDLDVEMDLYGGKGVGAEGGEGGFSRIRFTMKQNEEYVIAGLIDSINAPFVYRKGALMVCVGEGGGESTSSNGGGDGGGVDVMGDAGQGANSSGGSGANRIGAGGLTLSGEFGGSFTAPTLYPGDIQRSGNGPGRTIRCAKGVYWAQQGVGACTAMSPEMKFRLSDGTVITNTAEIVRGYKAGYNIMQTSGGGIRTGGRGGNGATGGQGGVDNSGGGGGSGYTDGSVTIVSTRLGGSTGDAKILLRMQS